MNILSVDFDYFIKASDKAQILFPDGGAEFSFIDDFFVWMSAYGTSMMCGDPLISETSVDTKALRRVSDIIKKNVAAGNRAMIADSHRHAYDFIRKYGDSENVIYNIDYHHDCFLTQSNEVHCGNWMRKLMEKGLAKNAYWIKRRNSSHKDKPKAVSALPFSKLPETYDLIFVCRSGWWTPPHLDTYFVEYLADPLLKQDEMTVSFQQDIGKSRYTDELREAASQIAALQRQEYRKTEFGNEGESENEK